MTKATKPRAKLKPRPKPRRRPKAGRPEYEPSDSDRATVQSLAVLGATHERIALCLGDKGITAKTLRTHFRRELDVSLLQIQALATSKVVSAIRDGQPWAISFFLKCKGGWKETSALDEIEEIYVKRLVGVAVEEL